jgi:hypothetical protein
MKPFRSADEMLDAHELMFGDAGRRAAEMVLRWLIRCSRHRSMRSISASFSHRLSLAPTTGTRDITTERAKAKVHSFSAIAMSWR